ncbi:MAG: ion transporter [Bacteriovoracaceae bacterium]|jgi:voltage-gated potassium channel|nr:ion transporter [Bacteriovoracaceae bacterium]
MKKRLNEIVNETNTPQGRAFNWFIQILILASIIQLTVETVPEFSNYKNIFHIIEIILTCAFVIEYLLRVSVAESKSKFIFSFYGLVDFFAILPTILSAGLFDLRFIRAFRFLRAIRIFKLARYAKAMERLHNAFKSVKEELTVFSILSLIILYISSAGIYFFEHKAQPEQFKSIIHSFWWSLSTLTTVGYGDVYPVTPGGKVFTFFILVLGIGIVSVPAALLAAAFQRDNTNNKLP